jgi:hypothetical protein
MPLDEADSGSVSSWTKSFTDLSNGMEVTTTTVAEYSSINKTLWLVNLELSNGAKFADISFGKAISKIGEQTEYRFNQFHQLTIGDSILLFNNETNSVEESIISNIQYSYEKINVYSVDVEPLDYILTTEEGVTIPKYAIFQHNPAPLSCTAICCGAWNDANMVPQCVGLDTGYCYNGYYEYCMENGYGIPYGCNGCVHACASCGGGFAPK